MLCSVNSCIESLTNPEGRLATLDGLFCLRDECGAPRFSITSYSVNFAVEWRGLSYTLKCQVCDDPEVRRGAEMLCRRLAAVDSPYLTTYVYCPGELLVFDDTGRPMRLDVILQRQPQGVSLCRFVEMCSDDSSRSAAIAAFRSLCAMARWCGEFGMVHRNLKPHNMVVSPLGHVAMVNYEFALLRRGDDDVRRLLSAAAALFVAACVPGRSGRFAQPLLSGHAAGDVVTTVANAARHQHLGAVEELMAAYSESRSSSVSLDRLLDLLSQLENYGDALYHKMDSAVARILNDRSSECAAGFADHDFSVYEFTGPECDGMICVKDLDGYKYLDRSGRRMIDRTYIYATDFAEGRAVVVTESGMALIDVDGRCVIGPDCDDVTWDCCNNVAVVARSGYWGLFDRGGNPITGLIFDWMGECDCGLIPVERAGRYGYIDIAGEEVIPCLYDQVYSFRDGKALVELRGEHFTIDTSGNRY